MSIHQSALDLVIRRFADIQKRQVEYLYRENPIFYEICQDYAECIRMRDKYADDPTILEAPCYEHDYERLIEALEEELYAFLRASQFTSLRQVSDDDFYFVKQDGMEQETSKADKNE